MYAKSFISRNAHGHLISALTAQESSDSEYTCHLCNSSLVFHRKAKRNRPWFEHVDAGLSEHARQHCPYVNVDDAEVATVEALRIFVPKALPLVKRADWRCGGCRNTYYGEKYCLTCQRGDDSQIATTG